MTLVLSTLVVLVALVAIGAYFLSMYKSAQAVKNFPITGQLIDVTGTKIHVAVMGAGADLVVIHGSSGNLRDFTTSLAPRLAKAYRVILLDRPGLGHSEGFDARGETLRDQALMLRDVSLQLGVKKPLVLGHSFGGAVALAWALHAPKDISALILLSAPSHPWDTGLSAYYKIMSAPFFGNYTSRLVCAFAPERAIQKNLKETFSPQTIPEDYRDKIGLEPYLQPKVMLANARQRRNLKKQIREMTPHYPKISVPTEIVHGTSDHIVPLEIHAKLLAKDLPNSNLTALTGIGHMPHHWSQEAVCEAINNAAISAGLRSDQ